MMVDVAIYLSGRYVAEHPDAPVGVTEVEDLIRWVFDVLGRDPGDLHLLARADGEPLDDDAGYQTLRVDNLGDWAWNVDPDESAEFVITRYVPIAEARRTYPRPAPVQAETLDFGDAS